MNPLLRAAAILIDPPVEWARIEHDSGDPAYLLSRYVAVLALVPAVFGFVGACVVGVTASGAGPVRTPLIDGLFGAAFAYVAAFATVLVLGFVINLLAPLFGGRVNFESAFKLAVYSYTPAWLAGIFLLLPGLRFLTLTGLYGAYLFLVGLPQLTKLPAPKSPIFAALIAVIACAVAYLTAIAQRVLFGTAGL